MKTTFTIIVAGALSAFPGFSQELQTEWVTNAGGQFYDQANAIDVDKDGNFFVTGYFQSDATFDNHKVDASGDTDFFIAKYDGKGTLNWVRCAGSDYNRPNVISEFGSSLATDEKGNVYVAGCFRRVADFGKQKITSSGKDDIFLAKYSAGGSLLWVTKAGGNSQDVVHDIAADATGNVYVTGYFQNEAMFDDTHFWAGEVANFFVAKYNGEGKLLWIKEAKQTGNASGNAIRVFNNDLFLAGNFEGRLVINDLAVNAAGGQDAFIAKFSANGECALLASKGTAGTEHLNALDVNDTGIFITGWLKDDRDENQRAQAFVSELSLLGDTKWTRRFRSKKTSEGVSIAAIAHGQIIVTGGFSGSIELAEEVKTGHDSGEVFIAELDNSGQVIWSEVSTAEGQKSVSDIAFSDGSIIMAGAISGNVSESDVTANSFSSSDIYLRKVMIPGRDHDPSVEFNLLNIYPNPSKGSFDVSYEFAKPQPRSTFSVYDIFGKVVFRTMLDDSEKVEIHVSLAEAPKGAYTVEIRSDDLALYRKVIIK